MAALEGRSAAPKPAPQLRRWLSLRSSLSFTMKTFNLSCSFPTDPVYVFLFTEVSNAIELRSRLLAGDPECIYAFLDARMVLLPQEPTTTDRESTAGSRCCQPSLKR
jgi:hypothetical protein